MWHSPAVAIPNCTVDLMCKRTAGGTETTCMQCTRMYTCVNDGCPPAVCASFDEVVALFFFGCWGIKSCILNRGQKSGEQHACTCMAAKRARERPISAAAMWYFELPVLAAKLGGERVQRPNTAARPPFAIRRTKGPGSAPPTTHYGAEKRRWRGAIILVGLGTNRQSQAPSCAMCLVHALRSALLCLWPLALHRAHAI
jgi:hypothetical protein